MLLKDCETNETLIIPEDSESEILYSTWLCSGDEYSPATDLRVEDKLPSGIYKMISTQDGYKVIKTKIDSDELYVFSESYTKKVLDEIQDFWDRADIYAKHHITHKRGLLIEGNPGSGKSATITLLVNQLLKRDGLVFLVNNAEDFHILMNTMKPIIRKIEPTRPIITIIEDVDQLIEVMNTESFLLDFMDGKTSIDHHLIILTSNDTSNLSSALLRPSRIDMRFELPNPNKKIRKEYFEKKGIQDAELYAEKTSKMSFAELKEVFIGTQILGKDLDSVISQITNPLKAKSYLSPTKTKIGL